MCSGDLRREERLLPPGRAVSAPCWVAAGGRLTRRSLSSLSALAASLTLLSCRGEDREGAGLGRRLSFTGFHSVGFSICFCSPLEGGHKLGRMLLRDLGLNKDVEGSRVLRKLTHYNSRLWPQVHSRSLCSFGPQFPLLPNDAFDSVFA